MIRVLEIRPNPISKNNGINTYCLSLRALFQQDSEVDILPIDNYPQRRTKFLHEVYDYKSLRLAILKAKPDIVHINGYTSFSIFQAFCIAKKLGCRIIYTAHWHPFKYLKHPLRGRVFFSLLIKPFVKRWADLVIGINNEDFGYFNSFHKNVVQIPHWNNKECISVQKKTKKANMILFVGRVSDENKGVEHLYHLPEGKYEIHCVGVGDMPIRSDIVRHVNISYDELEQLYNEASLLVVPSKYEAFSYVALEALRSGTPILISDGVRIADYLKGIEGCAVFHYHDFKSFVNLVGIMIGKIVDINMIEDIFSPEKIKVKYKDAILGIF